VILVVSHMESPQQFMELFLREEAQLDQAERQLYHAFHERFYANDYLALLQRIVSIEDLGDSAKVVTKGPYVIPKHSRYHLRRTGTSWRISGLEWECLGCDGSGRRRGKPCEECRGIGWRDRIKEDTSLEPAPYSQPGFVGKLLSMFTCWVRGG